jgi:hypothetical protein
MVFHFRLIRRSVYNQVGGIDNEFMYCQDYRSINPALFAAPDYSFTKLIANSVISASRASDRGFKLFQVDARTIAAGLICLKLSEVTDILHLQKPLYYYRHHKNSISCEQRIEQILLGKRAIEML